MTDVTRYDLTDTTQYDQTAEYYARVQVRAILTAQAHQYACELLERLTIAVEDYEWKVEQQARVS